MDGFYLTGAEVPGSAAAGSCYGISGLPTEVHDGQTWYPVAQIVGSTTDHTDPDEVPGCGSVCKLSDTEINAMNPTWFWLKLDGCGGTSTFFEKNKPFTANGKSQD